MRRITRGRKWMLAALPAVPGCMLLLAAQAQAQTWNVDCSVPDLVSAFAVAQTAGGGMIDVASGCTHMFTVANSDFDGENALPVLESLSSPLTIDDLTLENGVATGDIPDYGATYGGAIAEDENFALNDPHSLTLNDDTFLDNSAPDGGAAVVDADTDGPGLGVWQVGFAAASSSTKGRGCYVD